MTRSTSSRGAASGRATRRPVATRTRATWRATPLLILATACAQPPSADASFAGELAVRSLVAAVESADTALILDLFWPEATYDDYSNQLTYQGAEEIVGYVTGAHAWGDDVYMNIGRVHAGPAGATAEWVFSAVQARAFGDLAPTGSGREIVLNGVTIVEMRGTRILRAADYTDTAPMLLQLGSRIELPGGRVIELGDGG